MLRQPTLGLKLFFNGFTSDFGNAHKKISMRHLTFNCAPMCAYAHTIRHSGFFRYEDEVRTAGVPVTLAESVCHALAHLQSVAVS